VDPRAQSKPFASRAYRPILQGEPSAGRPWTLNRRTGRGFLSVSHLSARQALRAAAPLPLSEVDITGCIESGPRTEAGKRQLTPAEAAFAQAFATSLQQLPQAQRAGLQATAGNIAEAVVEVVLVGLGWSPLYHDERRSSGGHGVDLVMLTPSMDKVAAIEVKATLQPDRWPRLAPVRMNQMTTQWLDQLGNAGMIATELQAADVYGLIAMVQFARRQLKAAVTEDFVSIR
jgi:hypothetical protein